MSDDASRTGPFYVRWHDPAPTSAGEIGRAGPAPMLFQNLDDAMRFVMEAVPAASRATAWIDASAGPSVQIDEIVSRYEQAAASDPAKSNPLRDLRAGVSHRPPSNYWGTSSDPDWRPGSPNSWVAPTQGVPEHASGYTIPEVTTTATLPPGRQLSGLPPQQPPQPQSFVWPGPDGLPSTALGAATGNASPEPSTPSPAPPLATPVSVDVGLGSASGADIRSDATMPIGAPPPITNVMPVRRATSDAPAELNRIYSPTVSGGSGPNANTVEPPQQTAPGVGLSAAILIATEDQVQLIQRLDTIEARFQQIMPTLEAISAALDERPQIGHNNPPEGIDSPPLDVVDLELKSAAINAARVEIGKEQARDDVLRLSALSLKKLAASISVWLATKGDTFAEAFAKAAGTEAGRRLVQGGYVIALYPALHQIAADLGEFATHILKIVGY